MIIIPAFPEEWSLAFCRPWIRLGHPLEIAGTFQKLFEARRRIHVGDRDGDPGSEVIRVPPTHSYNAGKAGLRWMDECVRGEQSYARAHAHAYPHTRCGCKGLGRRGIHTRIRRGHHAAGSRVS